jgi:hypothetical protein
MEMKLTFAPFVFSVSKHKLPPQYKPTRPKAFLSESLLTGHKSRPTDAAGLSRMSLSSLLYFALMGEDAASH